MALQLVPDKVLLDGKTFACPAVPYVIKHNKNLTRDKVATLLSLCRAMVASKRPSQKGGVASKQHTRNTKEDKEVVVAGILCYAMPLSGLSEEEWLAIEIADCPHLPKGGISHV